MMLALTRRTLLLIGILATSSGLLAQQQPPGARGGQAPAPPPTPRAASPVDLTGVWVSVVSEDWRWRMMTPARGDYTSVPMTPAARTVADAWDPARDEAAGEQCRAYAAPAIMRVPGRLRISWEDDYTLRLDADAGTQTRLLQFQRPNAAALTAPASAARTWQGFSVARWEPQPGPVTGGAAFAQRVAPQTTRSLEVTTTQIRPGYLRKNGVPFSNEAVLTEYYDRWRNGSGEWFTVTTIVRDPEYLRQPFVTTSHFKREPNDAKWDPTPCSAR
jgi:hypothetical protein